MKDIKLNLGSKLRHYIEIYEQVMLGDDMGGSSASWMRNQEIRAMIEPVFSISSRTETFQAMQFLTTNVILFTVRFQNDITNKMRIRYKKRFFEILRIVNHQEQNVKLQIIAKEILDET